jgi:hypothetical protein
VKLEGGRSYREINICNPIRALRSACSHASIESVSSGLVGIHCDGSMALVVARVQVGYWERREEREEEV